MRAIRKMEPLIRMRRTKPEQDFARVTANPGQAAADAIGGIKRDLQTIMFARTTAVRSAKPKTYARSAISSTTSSVIGSRGSISI